MNVKWHGLIYIICEVHITSQADQSIPDYFSGNDNYNVTKKT